MCCTISFKIIYIRIQKIAVVVLICLLSFSCASARKAKKLRGHLTDQIIHVAHTFIGTPYQWGGATKAGMDCSGLLFNVFKAINVDLPRTAKKQAREGKKVRLTALKAGDLIFFSTGNKKNQVTHAGIVVQVKGKKSVKFIHASSSEGVIKSNLYTDYYLKRFRGAKRIIQ